MSKNSCAAAKKQQSCVFCECCDAGELGKPASDTKKLPPAKPAGSSFLCFL